MVTPQVDLVLGVAAAIAGLVIVAAGVSAARRPVTDLAGYLRELDGEETTPDEFRQRLAEPFVSRILRPLGSQTLRGLTRFTPSSHVGRVQHRLVVAGLDASVRGEDVVSLEVLAILMAIAAATVYAVVLHPAIRLVILAMVGAPVVVGLLPGAWLARAGRARQSAIRKDLPDTLDLLAISVEAGMGFEGAIDVVVTHFTSPLAEEFSRTLKEMELGLPRRDAFHNLKRRTEVPELSNFVLAITQADALGIPIGRVLKGQAQEMRSRRRQWARERAGKLPVKIMFPLILFIFPAILVILLGPAASNISRAFR
ncbi:MAG: type II secretion system F family protein [Acidimicrobiales bacterium]